MRFRLPLPLLHLLRPGGEGGVLLVQVLFLPELCLQLLGLPLGGLEGGLRVLQLHLQVLHEVAVLLLEFLMLRTEVREGLLSLRELLVLGHACRASRLEITPGGLEGSALSRVPLRLRERLDLLELPVLDGFLCLLPESQRDHSPYESRTFS